MTGGAIVARPMRLPSRSVNQRLPSGPVVMKFGPLPAVMPAENSVTVPPVVMRPILLPLIFGEPEVAVRPRPRCRMQPLAVGMGYSVNDSRRRDAADAVAAGARLNQTLPSGPAAMPTGPLNEVGDGILGDRAICA